MPLPSIAAHLGVKDEIGLIAPCVAHLRAIGVREIVVHDIASRDGTRDWLAGQPDLTVIDTADEDTDAAMSARIMAAVRAMRADWVLLLDADEFVLPRGGDLRAALAGVAADLVAVPRYNVVLGPAGMRMPLPPGPGPYGAIDLYAGADRWYRKKLAEDPMLTWLRFVPLPKVMLRLDRVRDGTVTGLADGMHDVRTGDGAVLERVTADAIVTAHAALSDYPRFAAKVDNIRATLALQEGDLAANFGWTWRRWAEQADAGTLRDEYDRSVVDEASIAELRASGVIASAAELLTPQPAWEQAET